MSELERALHCAWPRARGARRGRSRARQCSHESSGSRRYDHDVAVGWWRSRCVLLAALAATLAIPDPRSALFRVLHIGGERIELVDELPDISRSKRSGAHPRESKWRSRRHGARAASTSVSSTRLRIAFTWGAGNGLVSVRDARARPSPRGADSTSLRSTSGLILKKLAAPDHPGRASGRGLAQGAFLNGEPHFVFLLDEFGQIVDESARLAANVLVWDDGGVAYRLEGELPRATRPSISPALLR